MMEVPEPIPASFEAIGADPPPLFTQLLRVRDARQGVPHLVGRITPA